VGTGGALVSVVPIDADLTTEAQMRNRMLSAALVALLVPVAMHAASPTTNGPLGVNGVAVTQDDDRRSEWRGDDPRCGRGNAWGCRRGRDDDRYEDRYDRRADRWERERWERERARERYERARWERERYERARYRARYGYYDRRYERYDGYAVACLRAGGRVLGAVLVVCVP
jgi:hypothetical protein